MNRIVTSIPNESHIKYLKSMGFKNFNIHLLDQNTTPQKIKQIIASTGVSVKSIHVPYSDTEKVLLENINKTESIHYGAMISELLYSNEPIYLVCHTELGSSVYNTPEMLYTIVNRIDKLLSAHSHTILAIENTMIFNSLTQTISQSALPDYSKLIKELKKQSKYPDRICSVLDICHAQSTIYAIKKIFPYWKINLESYFKEAKDICSVMHLSNSYNYGYTPSSHGIGFDDDSTDELHTLDYINKLYETYIPNALFVYEISEHDYSERIELQKTINSMKKIGRNPF